MKIPLELSCKKLIMLTYETTIRKKMIMVGIRAYDLDMFVQILGV